MTKVQLVEKAVKKLGRADLAKFRKWFHEFDAAAWDRRFERDVATGKLASLAAEALGDYKLGKTRAL